MRFSEHTCMPFLVSVFFSLQLTFVSSDRPNIVFVLTDDQDVTMGGQTPMVKTKKLVGGQGITFQNMFVSSPLCCPSRSSIFSGRYVHNHRTLNNSLTGNCSSLDWQITQEATAFPTVIKSRGYSTFFAGKYLNQYGTPDAGGAAHVPPGWDVWNGLVGNSKYYNYKLSLNGVEESHGNKYPDDYLTDVIHRRAIDFLQKRKGSGDPFFMMLSTPACHGPFTPAPQYNNNYPDEMSPRNGSYNIKAKEPAMNIDFAPTFVEIVDNTILPNIDGISLLPLLHRSRHSNKQPPPPRNTILIEHTGEYMTDTNCGTNLLNCNKYCVCGYSKNNTFSCVIDFTVGETFKYCEMQDDVNFVELYDTMTDPHELNNMRDIINPVTKSELQKKLRYLEKCVGPKCIVVPDF